ncbi:MAG: hypothetical protein AAGF54_06260 [Pseudomonadota bacterium]
MEPNNASKIRDGIQNLEVMSRFALAILSVASGVYTYLGVRSLIDGSSSQVFFASVIYATAVSVGIYAFWTYLMKFIPLIHDGARRLILFGAMALGSIMIIAMSSWLNAAALAGSAATEQHLALTLEGYVQDLDKANAKALSAQSLLPDVQRASERFKRLASEERTNGALTGTSGSGSVVQLLTQMGDQLDELATTISSSRKETESQFEKGREHLARMRTLVSGTGAVQPRADDFGAEAIALAGVIAELQETAIAPSVRRAAEDLSLGFIAPIADGSTQDLALRQNTVIDTVKASVAAQSSALAAAADQILSEPGVPSRRFVPLSSAEAVLVYAGDFVPSWAGAISIDLLPAVLVLVLCVAHSAIRQENQSLDPAEKMSAADMMRAVSLYQGMTSDSDKERSKAEEEEEDTSDNTTLLRPIDASQRKRIEDSR